MDNDNDSVLTDEDLAAASGAVWPGFGLPLIDDLPNPIPLEKLMDNDFAVIVQRLTGEAIRCNQIRDSIELIYRLRFVDSLRTADQGVYDFYRNLIVLLRFVSFMARKQKDARNLLADDVIMALKSGIEVVDNLRDYVKIYEDETGLNKQMRQELTYALENNREQIGSQTIILEGTERVSPTLQNWIKDYNVSQHLTSARGKFNQINYLNTSSNARQLANEDKNILEKVLNIYDWLLFPPLNTAINPAELQTAESALGVTYLTSDKFVLPKEVYEPESLMEETPVSLSSAIPPKVPAPLGQAGTQKVRMSDIMGDRGLGGQAVSSQQSADRGEPQKISNSQFPISKEGDSISVPTVLGTSPLKEERGRSSGIAVMPPSVIGQGKVLAPPLVTAETLAAQMEKRKQQSAVSSQQIGMNASPPLNLPPQGGGMKRQEGGNAPSAPSKAESFVQRQIDSKLQDLEKRTKGKNN